MTHPDPYTNRLAYLRHLSQVYGIPFYTVMLLAEGLGPRALQSTFRKELADWNCFNRNDDDKEE